MPRRVTALALRPLLAATGAAQPRSPFSPFDGEVLYILGTPPVSRGEPVAFIGARAPAPPRP